MPRAALLVLLAALGLGLVVFVRHGRRGESSRTPSAPAEVEDAASGLRGASAPAERTAERGAAESVTSDPLAALLRLADEHGRDLDLATDRLDPAVLEPLRAAVRASGLDADALLAAAEREAVGSARRCLLLLAIAWSEGPLDAASEALTAFAVELASPLDAVDRQALAATHALALAARTAELEHVAGTLLANAYAADRGEPTFPGLASVRAWIALEGARDLGPVESGHAAEWLDPARARYRVTHELWALAARAAPETWFPALLERVRAGDEHAREGLAAVGDARFRDELFALLDEPWGTGADAWNHGAAARGLVAIGDAASLARLSAELDAVAPRRDRALEALASWRTSGDPGALLGLGARLEGDAARAAWASGLRRAWDRLRFLREESPERARFLAALDRVAATGAGAAAELAAELRALERP